MLPQNRLRTSAAFEVYTLATVTAYGLTICYFEWSLAKAISIKNTKIKQ